MKRNLSNENRKQILLLDADGVVIQPPTVFSAQYKKTHTVSNETIRAFFTQAYVDCTLGNRDLKEVLSKELKNWDWEGDVDAFTELWFESENYPNTELIEMIQKSRTSGVQAYVATNHEQYRIGHMKEKMHFDTLFDGIFGSCDVGVRKPEKDFYIKVCKNLRVQPEDCMYFDDDEKNIHTARELGMSAWFYQGNDQIRDILIDYNLMSK